MGSFPFASFCGDFKKRVLLSSDFFHPFASKILRFQKNEKKLFHLRGAIDYSQLELKYRILMKMMYSQALKMPEEQLTPEFKAVLATYGQTVDYVDFEGLRPVADAVNC